MSTAPESPEEEVPVIDIYMIWTGKHLGGELSIYTLDPPDAICEIQFTHRGLDNYVVSGAFPLNDTYTGAIVAARVDQLLAEIERGIAIQHQRRKNEEVAHGATVQ